jgi:hypothetical protein
MIDKFFKKTGKTIFLLMVANIFALFLISSVPIFYETISADDPDFWMISPPVAKNAVINNPDNQSMIKIRVHYNFYTMQKRDDSNISKLSEDLRGINYCLWCGLIFSVVAFVGLILYSTQKYQKKALILMSIGFIVIVFASLNLFLEWSFINTVNSYDDISFSAIWEQGLNLNYFYLIFFVGMISFFGSLSYFGRVGYRFLNQRRETKKKEAYEQLVNKKDEIPSKSRVDEKAGRPFFGDSSQKKSDVVPVSNISKKMELEKNSGTDVSLDEKKVERESFFDEREKKDENIKPQRTEEKTVESDVFESKSAEEENVSYKEVKIRCPKCKHVFKVKKKIDGVTKMYCPQCGQKGVLK